MKTALTIIAIIFAILNEGSPPSGTEATTDISIEGFI
jgi:hypothetical protein